MTAQRACLAGNRLHFSHGPIDLVIGAHGEAQAVAAAHEAAWQRFQGLLTELVAELPQLRKPVSEAPCLLQGPVARRMWRAVHPMRRRFITPMAAVAGSVAQEIAAAYARPGVERAWVNNGGDMALHLQPNATLRVGLAASPDPRRLAAQGLDGRFEVTHDMPVRGVATSGWGGRSFSLGIADSVTVLSATAAQADAAATVVANAVNVDDARIERRAANGLSDQTDLGELAVTVAVPALATSAVDRALDAGLRVARALQHQQLLYAAVLVCQGRQRVLALQ